MRDRTFVKLIEQFPDLFLKADDEAWLAWVDVKRREIRDLNALVDGDFRDSIKARAMLVLMMPGLRYLPIYWNRKGGRKEGLSYLRCAKFDVDKLSSRLQEFLVAMVLAFDTPELKKYTEGYGDHAVRYNRLRASLSSLPGGDVLFDGYRIKDAEVYWNMEDCSGYNPYRSLFFLQGVSEDKKRLADSWMCEIVLSEVSGETTPRADHENALHWYIETMTVSMLYGEPSYSTDFFADQLTFVLSLQGIQNLRTFETHHLEKILEVLSGSEYDDIVCQVCKHMLTRAENPIDIGSGRNLAVAQLMYDRFADHDDDLRLRLEEIIAAESDIASSRKAFTDLMSSEEDAVVDALR